MSSPSRPSVPITSGLTRVIRPARGLKSSKATTTTHPAWLGPPPPPKAPGSGLRASLSPLPSVCPSHSTPQWNQGRPQGTKRRSMKLIRNINKSRPSHMQREGHDEVEEAAEEKEREEVVPHTVLCLPSDLVMNHEP
ncbi:predicted protein [Histoplasma capsulatum var. duboisii H88]|uniref:Predicted protein n=2 Tax=Ajellomyces capsulatus TaxID=5037 RepID=F0UAV2_AJEC8|nr:predicted protein [Histoplasma capsulatum H143]EGC43759.1 predicted protein [Histoplasma capsulatum var. duboisii H88]